MRTEVDNETVDGTWAGSSDGNGPVRLSFLVNGEFMGVDFTAEQFVTFRALIAVL